MSYTRKQLNRILKVGKHDLLGSDQLPLSVRVTESFTRRRLFAMEDQAVIDQFALYRQAYRDLRDYADTAAQRAGISQLDMNGDSTQWRRLFLAQAEPRLKQLGNDVAYQSAKAAMNHYLMGYYGRAWGLRSRLAPNLPVDAPTPSRQAITQRVLQGHLKEAPEPESLLYDLLGVEWRDKYQTALNDLIGKMKASLDGSIQDKVMWPEATQRLATVMGIDDGTSGSFGRVQTITRTYLMGSSNTGAADLYDANRQYLAGVEWYATLGDGRTCPFCLGLHGTVWTLDDPNRLTPPYDSHPLCRCALIPALIPNTETVPDDEPPALTFTQYVLSLGLAWLLDELRGRRTDSSRVGDDEAAEDEFERELEGID